MGSKLFLEQNEHHCSPGLQEVQRAPQLQLGRDLVVKTVSNTTSNNAGLCSVTAGALCRSYVKTSLTP